MVLCGDGQGAHYGGEPALIERWRITMAAAWEEGGSCNSRGGR
jgi:hypothetical protein